MEKKIEKEIKTVSNCFHTHLIKTSYNDSENVWQKSKEKKNTQKKTEKLTHIRNKKEIRNKKRKTRKY